MRTFEYDPLDRQTHEHWLDGAATIRTATYTYDAVGNLLTAGDPDSSYTMTYDELDRLASVDNLGTPGLPHVILMYAYDAVGNLIDTTENLGVTVVSTWDARNQLTSHAITRRRSNRMPRTLRRHVASTTRQWELCNEDE